MKSRIVNKGQQIKKFGNGLGRVVHPKSFWMKQCKAFELSGLKSRNFCESQGLAYSTFTKWLSKLRNEEVAQKGSFVRLEIESSAPLPQIIQKKASELDDPNLSSATSASSGPFIHQIEKVPELKLTFGKGLTLHIPIGFDASTLSHVVETLA